MNIELLKQVATKLRRMRHREHFKMDDWIQKNECGTAACVAGHALLLTGYTLEVCDQGCGGAENIVRSPKGRIVEPEAAARRLLRLSADQADKLFDPIHWPTEFGGANGDYWSDDEDEKQYNNPKVAAARIERFLATKGKE